MVDTTVATNPNVGLDDTNALWGPYWSDKNTAIIFYINSDFDATFSRTTDGGENWSATVLENGTSPRLSCWFDRETPTHSGDSVHVVWADIAGTIKYVDVAISTGTVGTIRTIVSGLTIVFNNLLNKVIITKTLNGNLIAAWSVSSEQGCYRSVDSGENWTSRATPFEASTTDWLLMYPAATGDNADACGIYWDDSENEISVKMYDDSENSWTETSISEGMIHDTLSKNMDAAVRISDNHIILAAHSNNDDATDDLKTWDLTVNSIVSPTITAKTNIFIDQGESAQVGIIINQQNNDVYVSYLKGGTWRSETDVVFHKSVDDMSTWGSEQVYSELSADDNRVVSGGRTITGFGGRIQWVWYNDDLTDLFVNLVNDIEIEPLITIQGISSITGVQSITI